MEKYRSLIDGLTVDASVSCEWLVNAIEATVQSTNIVATTAAPVAKKDVVTLAAIDVQQSLVHQVLQNCPENPVLGAKISDICKGKSLNEVLNDASLALACRFVVNTHVTLVHVSEIGIESLRSTFGPCVGKQIEMRATAVYWDDRVMALEVEFVEGTEVETSLTDFPHITIWVAEDAKAFESKKLKGLWGKGKAEKQSFGSNTFDLIGSVSLWPVAKTSFK